MGLEGQWYIAACRRGTYFGLALLSDSTILEVRRHRLLRTRAQRRLLAELLSAFARDYAVDHLIVEPGTLAHAAAQLTDLTVRTLTLEHVRKALLPRKRRRTLRSLGEVMVRRHPELRRLGVLIPANQNLNLECASIVCLVAVALGLAAPGATTTYQPIHNEYIKSPNYFTLCHT